MENSRGMLGHRTQSETICGCRLVTKVPLGIKESRVLGVSCTRHQRKGNVSDRQKDASCGSYILWNGLWIQHCISGFLGNTMLKQHGWPGNFSVVPTWESGDRPGCLAWAHNDCQGTSCCCLKNILQLPGFDVLQIPSLMKLPGQYWMKTNMGYYVTK